MNDETLMLFVRPKESPFATFSGPDVRIAYGEYWVDFRNGEVKVTHEPQPEIRESRPR